MYLFLAVVSLPVIIYFPFIRPRIAASKQAYLLGQYQYSHFLSRHFPSSGPQIRLRDMKAYLNKINTRL